MSQHEVLLVEDDFIVAYDMQTMLEEQGANVIGPASSLNEARELLARMRNILRRTRLAVDERHERVRQRTIEPEVDGVLDVPRLEDRLQGRHAGGQRRLSNTVPWP